MKGTFKKLLAVLLVGALFIALGACTAQSYVGTSEGPGSSSEASEPDKGSEKNYKILIGCNTAAQAFYKWEADAVEKVITEDYPDCTFTTFDFAGDPANVSTFFEMAVTGGYSGIIADFPDMADHSGQMKDLLDEGIYSVKMDSNIPDDVCVNVGYENYDLGYFVGEAAAELIPENAKILTIGSLSGPEPSNDRISGFLDGIKKAGRDDVEVLSQQDSKDWQKENAMNVMEDYTQRFNDGDFQVVFCVCDDMTCGAIEVCENAGYNMDNIQFYGIDGLANGCRKVQEGTMKATVLQNCQQIAELSVQALHEMMTGENTSPRSLLCDPLLITIDNVEDMLKTHEENGML
ncbi:MAG: sugar ABC transporter substrate-binding protein [Clostridiaceae bacterium]|nr:sugar ABC transporter substrate-binding protein [Clostridiaceae bacterium]